MKYLVNNHKRTLGAGVFPSRRKAGFREHFSKTLGPFGVKVSRTPFSVAIEFGIHGLGSVILLGGYNDVYCHHLTSDEHVWYPAFMERFMDYRPNDSEAFIPPASK